MDKEGHILPVGEIWTSDVTDDVTDSVADEVVGNDDFMCGNANNVTDDVTDVIDNVTDNVTDESTSVKRQKEMLHYMQISPNITTDSLANILHVSRRTIARDINLLRSRKRLERNRDDRNGSWVVID